MKLSFSRFYLAPLFACALLVSIPTTTLRAQAGNAQTNAQSNAPLKSDEFVRLVRQIPARPEMKETLIEEIRRRGIGFPLTAGLRSVVATKSGSDALLRRTLEEAERRRAGVATAALPPLAGAQALWERARAVALEHTSNMPDFVVRQQIARSYAYGKTRNWIPSDRLTVAAAFRESVGEQYKLLAVNGIPLPDNIERGDYEQARGSTSTGEFVSLLNGLFAPESRTTFRAVDTDTLRGIRTVVFEYEVKRVNSKRQIKVDDGVAGDVRAITVGIQGRAWIDPQSAQVWRIELNATDIPPDFAVRALTKTIDYDWTEINERRYMLPVSADVIFTANAGERLHQTRNLIRFRDYKKFGSTVEIIEDDEVVDDAPPNNTP